MVPASGGEGIEATVQIALLQSFDDLNPTAKIIALGVVEESGDVGSLDSDEVVMCGIYLLSTDGRYLGESGAVRDSDLASVDQNEPAAGHVVVVSLGGVGLVLRRSDLDALLRAFFPTLHLLLVSLHPSVHEAKIEDITIVI